MLKKMSILTLSLAIIENYKSYTCTKVNILEEYTTIVIVTSKEIRMLNC